MQSNNCDKCDERESLKSFIGPLVNMLLSGLAKRFTEDDKRKVGGKKAEKRRLVQDNKNNSNPSQSSQKSRKANIFSNL